MTFFYKLYCAGDQSRLVKHIRYDTFCPKGSAQRCHRFLLENVVLTEKGPVFKVWWKRLSIGQQINLKAAWFIEKHNNFVYLEHKAIRPKDCENVTVALPVSIIPNRLSCLLLWACPCLMEGVSGSFYCFHLFQKFLYISIQCRSWSDICSVASDQGLHYFPMSFYGINRLTKI